MSGLTSRWSFLNWFRSANAAEEETAVGTESKAGYPQNEQDEVPSQQTDVEVHPVQSQREQSIGQLEGAYQEVADLMHTLRDHMESQSDRSERLLQIMEGLPHALQSLPEAQRNQTRMLEAIQDHLAQQGKNAEGLTNAIQGLANAADNHERSMSIIQQQLDTNQQNDQQLLSSFSTLSQTLDRMSESNTAGTQVLERLADRSEQTDYQMRDLFARNQRQITMMSVVSWALAIVALGVAAAVAVWVGQSMTGSQASSSEAAAPTSVEVAPEGEAESAGLTGGEGGESGEMSTAGMAGIGGFEAIEEDADEAGDETLESLLAEPAEPEADASAEADEFGFSTRPILGAVEMDPAEQPAEAEGALSEEAMESFFDELNPGALLQGGFSVERMLGEEGELWGLMLEEADETAEQGDLDAVE